MVSNELEDGYSLIYCRECGKQCKQVTGKHLAKHGMTADDYRTKYPNAPLICQESGDKRSKNLSEVKKGKPAHNKGKPMTEEQKRKLSEAKKGKATRTGAVLSEETKQKISKSLTGRKLTEDHIQSLKDSVVRRKEEGTYVHSLANYTMTEEHKRKSGEVLIAINKQKSIDSEIALIETIKQYNLQFISKDGRRWTVLCTACNNYMEYDKQIFHPSKKPDTACPVCFPRMSGTSYGEQEMIDYIRTLTTCDVLVNNYSAIKGFEVDAYIPDLSVAFEYNGLYWHSVNSNKQRHPLHIKHKSQYAYRNGIRLIHIFSDEWDNRLDATKDLIRRVLNVSGEVINEEKYYIQEVENDELIRDFIVDNSILMDNYNGDVYIAAYRDDVIIAVGIFEGNDDGNYTLVDVISENNKDIENVNENVLTYFIESHNPTCILFKSNDNYWVGGYWAKEFGFVLEGREDPIPWLTKDFKSRIHPDTFPDKSLEDMRELGYDWIYDCGYSVWKLTI